MSHFSLKSLTFYGIAIGSVLILFKAVSAYGEANLKAPPAIGGVYRINTDKIAGCSHTDLHIQQSGVYLFAFLQHAGTSTQPTSAAEKELLLNGRIENQQFTLSGLVPEFKSCNQPTRRLDEVKIVGKIQDKAIAGQIVSAALPQAVTFTSEREQPLKQKQNEQH